MDSTQPGTVITPGGSTTPPVTPPAGAPEPERPAETPAEPMPIPAPTGPEQVVPTQQAASMSVATPLPPAPVSAATEPTAPQLVAPQSTVLPQQTPEGWFRQEPVGSYVPPASEPADSVSWTALEFIEHTKNAAWYSLFALAAFAIVVLVYLFTKDKMSTGIVALCLAAVGIYSARKPREQQYALDAHGIQVGARTYSFSDFRTFSVADGGTTVASVVLMPLKRFMLPLTLALDPRMEDAVVDYLAARLPFEQHKPDAIEGLLRRIRF